MAMASVAMTSEGLGSWHRSRVSSEDVSEKEMRREQYRKLLEENAGVSHLILAAIILGTTTTIVETMPEMSSYHLLFELMDGAIALCFSVELCLRFYVSTSFWEFFTNCFNVIDLMAVLPQYVEWILMLWHLEVHRLHQAAHSMRALRMTRIIRLVRLARMARVARLVKEWNALSQMELLLKVLLEETAHGSGANSLMLLGLVSLAFACLVYATDEPQCSGSPDLSWMASEHCDSFTFDSIPLALFWVVETLTTVGSTKMMPTSAMGRCVASLCSVASLGMLAYISSQFSMHFCQRWLRLQATQKMKHHEETSKSERLDALLLRFEDALQALSEEVAVAAVAAGSEEMRSMARSIESNGQILNSGVCTFLHEALTTAMILKDEPQMPAEALQPTVWEATLEHPGQDSHEPRTLTQLEAGEAHAPVPFESEGTSFEAEVVGPTSSGAEDIAEAHAPVPFESEGTSLEAPAKDAE